MMRPMGKLVLMLGLVSAVLAGPTASPGSDSKGMGMGMGMGMGDPYKDCDVSIVGAGIGGAYSAWRLAVDTNEYPADKVCVFERKDHVGGRAETVRNVPGYEGLDVDVGAYRFHTALHAMIRQLIDHLNLPYHCYYDPFRRGEAECGSVNGFRPWLTLRGTFYGPPNGTGDSILADASNINGYNFEPSVAASPRNPYSWLFESSPAFSRINDLLGGVFGGTLDYGQAMQLADELIDELHGSQYELRDGTFVPWNEITLRHVAENEGLTEEEAAYFFDADWDVGETTLTMASFDDIFAEYARYFALFANPRSNGQGHAMQRLIHPDTGLPAGFSRTTEVLLEAFEAAGGRVFLSTEVLGVVPDGNDIALTLASGAVVESEKVVLDVGNRDLEKIANFVLAGATDDFRATFASAFVAALSKTYCYWPEAWWLQANLAGLPGGQLKGRARTTEHIHNMRYHDGAVDCSSGDHDTGEGCRGAYLVAYYVDAGSTSIPSVWADSGLRTANAGPQNVRIMERGSLSSQDQVYWQDLLTQVRRVHSHLNLTIPDPDVCVSGLWTTDGPAVRHGPLPSNGVANSAALKPNPNLDVFLVNTDLSDGPGWSEGALRMAERVMTHHFGLGRPGFLDEHYYNSVIVNFNAGTAFTP